MRLGMPRLTESSCGWSTNPISCDSSSPTMAEGLIQASKQTATDTGSRRCDNAPNDPAGNSASSPGQPAPLSLWCGMPDALRVLIADDHVPTLIGIRDALERDGWQVCAEAPDAHEAIQLARQTLPDVCVLDISMPGNGIRAAATISAEHPDTAVVMLTASRDDGDLFDALRAGAIGYLLKDMDPERLGPALRGVLSGEAALPRHLMARVVEEFRGRSERRVVLGRRRGPQLTAREFEVLDMLRQGLTTDEVAKRLFISTVTVRGYVASALKKLRAPDRAAAFKMLADDEGNA